MSKWQQLTNILPDEVREQMAELMISRLGIGWGVVEVHVKDHFVSHYHTGEDVRGVRVEIKPPDKPPTGKAPPLPPGPPTGRINQ